MYFVPKKPWVDAFDFCKANGRSLISFKTAEKQAEFETYLPAIIAKCKFANYFYVFEWFIMSQLICLQRITFSRQSDFGHRELFAWRRRLQMFTAPRKTLGRGRPLARISVTSTGRRVSPIWPCCQGLRALVPYPPTNTNGTTLTVASSYHSSVNRESDATILSG
jgi:hypothetical protein